MVFKKLIVGLMSLCIVAGAVPVNSVDISANAATISSGNLNRFEGSTGVPVNSETGFDRGSLINKGIKANLTYCASGCGCNYNYFENGTYHSYVHSCKNKSTATYAEILSVIESGLPGDSPIYVHGIRDSVFKDCTKLKSVDIPEGIEIIGASAFQNCSSLATVNMPSSIKTIRNSAFKGCSFLKSIKISNSSCYIDCSQDTIPKNVTIYGHDHSTAYGYAVRNGRTFISLDTGAVTNFPLTYGNISEFNYVIKKDKLNGIYRGEYIEITGCKDKSVAKVLLNGTYSVNGKCLPVLSISKNAFKDCKKLACIEACSVVNIGDYAFAGCENLYYATFNSNLETVGEHAFDGCPIDVKPTKK